LQTLFNKGAIYKGTYEGLYCVGCEQFKTENELINGKCPDHNAIAESIKEECYIMKMKDMQKRLIDSIEKDEYHIAPERYKKEMLTFLKNQTLKDISISRKNVSWGIPLPFDTSHTTYVWIDAFLNYLTGIGWNGDIKIIPEQWPADIHLIGKDILRVHATIWPIILMHLGIELPKMLFTHGHFLASGKKMSKTLGNAIAISDMISKFGVDGTRYLLINSGTFGEDMDLTMERAAEKYTSDLANGIGNLVARVTSLAAKTPHLETQIIAYDQSLESFIGDTWKNYEMNLNDLKLNEAILVTRRLMSYCDEYIERNKPWQLKDTEKINVIVNLLEAIRHIAWMISPYMPETSNKIFSQIYANDKDKKNEIRKNLKEAQKWAGIKLGAKIKKGEILFPRLDTQSK
jgi:methionyl-tRNA synthetase